MLDDPDLPNGADPTETVEQAPLSIRDIASDAWDELEEGASAEESAGQGERKRDQYGRFIAQGEADPRVPAPDGTQPAPQAPTQPQPGVAVEAPQHWSAEVRARFQKLSPEDQSFLVDRHKEMEADYTRKTQASAAAVGFVQELMPIFEDPAIKQSLAAVGAPPAHAIREWAAFHKRAMSPNIEDRKGLLQDLAQRMGLDPAASVPSNQPPPAGLTPQHLADPAVKYMADQLGTALKKVASLEQYFNDFRTTGARRDIDGVADERDASGNLVRPDFNQYIPAIAAIIQVDPRKTIAQAYEDARWQDPQARERILEQQRATERDKFAREQALAKAQAASRGNLRGRTSPVSPPDRKANGPQTLRETIESSAEEIGF